MLEKLMRESIQTEKMEQETGRLVSEENAGDGSDLQADEESRKYLEPLDHNGSQEIVYTLGEKIAKIWGNNNDVENEKYLRRYPRLKGKEYLNIEDLAKDRAEDEPVR
ncbi:hypothetical protein D1007_34798 [Hordeum vulgare]|nr:hypothetical protein D1007_34798 [Hordeum vulgare]